MEHTELQPGLCIEYRVKFADECRMSRRASHATLAICLCKRYTSCSDSQHLAARSVQNRSSLAISISWALQGLTASSLATLRSRLAIRALASESETLNCIICSAWVTIGVFIPTPPI